MKRRLFIKGLFFIPWCGAALPADPLAAMQETPMFVDEVKAGRLPPVARRVPQQPLVVRTFAGNDGPGRQGGKLTMLVTGTRDRQVGIAPPRDKDASWWIPLCPLRETISPHQTGTLHRSRLRRTVAV